MEHLKTTDYGAMTLSQIAREVRKHWKKVYFGAVPYLEAMETMRSVDDDYGCDSGRDIVARFLSNANSFRGPVARAIKDELKKRFNGRL